MKVDVPGRGAVVKGLRWWLDALASAGARASSEVGVTIMDTDLPATSPLPQVPRVRYTDAGGRVHEGWYAFHEARQTCPLGHDRLRPGDCQHLIVSDGLADWNMPRDVRVQAIAPDGGEVELLGGGAAGDDEVLAAENLLKLLAGMPDTLHRELASMAAEECLGWIREMEGEDE